jgi:hypothetical protein
MLHYPRGSWSRCPRCKCLGRGQRVSFKGPNGKMAYYAPVVHKTAKACVSALQKRERAMLRHLLWHQKELIALVKLRKKLENA